MFVKWARAEGSGHKPTPGWFFFSFRICAQAILTPWDKKWTNNWQKHFCSKEDLSLVLVWKCFVRLHRLLFFLHCLISRQNTILETTHKLISPLSAYIHIQILELFIKLVYPAYHKKGAFNSCLTGVTALPQGSQRKQAGVEQTHLTPTTKSPCLLFKYVPTPQTSRSLLSITHLSLFLWEIIFHPVSLPCWGSWKTSFTRKKTNYILIHKWSSHCKKDIKVYNFLLQNKRKENCTMCNCFKALVIKRKCN